MNKNFDLVDVVKFILALCVVAIHSKLFHEQIYPFVRLAVPMFFMFSGYFSFLHLDVIQGKKEKDQKVLQIIKRLMQLYAFWLIILLPYTLYQRNYFQGGFLNGILIILRNLFLDSTFPASWYIMSTALGTLIIYKLSNRFSNTKILLITLPFYLFATIATEFRAELISVPKLGVLLVYIEQHVAIPCFTFIISLLYIALGKIMADAIKLLPTSRYHRLNLALFVICLLGLLMEYTMRRNSKGFIYSCDCLLMLAPTALSLVLMILSSEVKIKNAVRLRKLSTIIFCSHIPTISVVLRLLNVVGISDSQRVLTYVLTVLTTTILGIIIFRLEQMRQFRFLRFSH